MQFYQLLAHFLCDNSVFVSLSLFLFLSLNMFCVQASLFFIFLMFQSALRTEIFKNNLCKINKFIKSNIILDSNL